MQGLMTKNQQTEILVERARRGDRSAFEELFNTHRGRLQARISERLSSQLRRRVDPEDILQDAFSKAFETIDRFRWQGDNSFFAWIASIAEHLILNASRKKQLQMLQLDRDVPKSSATPVKALEREERFERLKSSLEKLGPDQRKAVILARIDGLPVREIAQQMKRSEDAVRQLLTRALRQLRSSFGDTESLHLPNRSLTEEGFGDE